MKNDHDLEILEVNFLKLNIYDKTKR